MPSARTSLQTAMWLTRTPRDDSSAASARVVIEGCSAILAKMKARSPSSLRGGTAPCFAGATLPVCRTRCDHFTTADTDIANRSAASRPVAPTYSANHARGRNTKG